MTLIKGIIGQEYIVSKIDVDENVGRRLQALGLTLGTKIKVLNNKKSGSIIFKVRGTRLAIGRKIADGISVTTLEEDKMDTAISKEGNNNAAVGCEK